MPRSRKDVLRNLSYLNWCDSLSSSIAQYSLLFTLKTYYSLKVLKCTFSCLAIEGKKVTVRSGIRTHASRGDCDLNAAP